jgi:predicted nucleic acid-binding protein
MIIVDTSIWIEFLQQHEPFATRLPQLMEGEQVLIAEPIVGELLQGSRKGREQRIILDFWENLPKWDERGIWIKAGHNSLTEQWSSKGVGLIDAFIISLARETHSQIWTLDKKLSKLLKPSEQFFHYQ